jgi:hypothetical protein
VPASRVCRLVDEAPEPLWDRLADFSNWRMWLDRVRRYDCDQGNEQKIGELFVALYHEFIVNLTSPQPA